MPALAPLPLPTRSNPALHRESSRLPSVTEANTVDLALVKDFLAGDEAAFVEIMERHRGRIYSVTHNLLRNHADAEEITQDTFIRAHRGLATFRGEASLSSWLFRIAVNLARNRYWYFFRRHRQDSLSLDCALGENNNATFADLVAARERNPAQESVAGEFAALVDRCMQRLDPRHREILTLRNVRGHSYEEIAATLGTNIGTVKSRIARARENLRTLLSEVCPELDRSAALGEWFLPSRTAPGSPMIVSA